MEYLLALIYTGEMIFPPDQEADIYDAMQCLLIGEHADFSLQKITMRHVPEVVPPSSTSVNDMQESASGKMSPEK